LPTLTSPTRASPTGGRLDDAPAVKHRAIRLALTECDAEGCYKVAEALVLNTTLIETDLSNNILTSEAATEFAQACEWELASLSQ
jgi:hypothetical protein